MMQWMSIIPDWAWFIISWVLATPCLIIIYDTDSMTSKKKIEQAARQIGVASNKAIKALDRLVAAMALASYKTRR